MTYEHAAIMESEWSSATAATASSPAPSTAPSLLIVICAWCNRYLHGAGDSVDGMSHGICEGCKGELMAEVTR
jgi:hypothetical protein